MPRNNSRSRRDRRYNAAVARQAAAHERHPARYAPVEVVLQRDELAAAAAALEERRHVIVKYARLFKSGRPVLCTPSRAELADPAARRCPESADWKVIYDDHRSAVAAARELEAAGADPMRPYVCKRGTRGHLHLTSIVRRHREVASV